MAAKAILMWSPEEPLHNCQVNAQESGLIVQELNQDLERTKTSLRHWLPEAKAVDVTGAEEGFAAFTDVFAGANCRVFHNDNESDCFPQSILDSMVDLRGSSAAFPDIPTLRASVESFCAQNALLNNPSYSSIGTSGAPTTTEHVYAFAAALAGKFTDGIAVCHVPAGKLVHFLPAGAPTCYHPTALQQLWTKKRELAVLVYTHPLGAAVGHFCAVLPIERIAATSARPCLDTGPLPEANAAVPDMSGGSSSGHSPAPLDSQRFHG